MTEVRTMSSIIIGRTALFCGRYKHAWISADASWSYHNLICTVSLATLLIGFEYVWREARSDLKKKSIGWDWHPKY